MELKTLAKTGYEAYGDATDHKNFRGEPMPQFEDLTENITNAWESAARQIVKTHELGKTHETIKSGFAGTMPNGSIVDRRVYPEAIPLQQNSMLGVPKPNALDEPQAHS